MSRWEEDVRSFVLATIGATPVALPGEEIRELISSPVVHEFPHTTPIISGVVVRRGRIIPIVDLGPRIFGRDSPTSRFFLILEHAADGKTDRCAIPVQGECELVSEVFNPCDSIDGVVVGYVNREGKRIDVLSIEGAMEAGRKGANPSMTEKGA